MSQEEREFVKHVDDAILQASGNTLKKLQELDKKTQLHGNTFYDEYVSSLKNKKEKLISKTNSYGKNKPQ